MAGINKLGFLNSLIEIVNNDMEEDAATSVLARYFLVNFNRLPELNIYDVAENCFVTRSSVRRFCQSLGFDNYKELKKQLENVQDNYHYYKDVVITENYGQKTAEELYQMALDCNSNLRDYVEKISDYIHESNQVVFLVSDIYSRQCNEFQKGMILLGKMVKIVGQQYENNKLLSRLAQNDMVITVSVGGFFAEASIKIIQNLTCKKILLTSKRSKKYKTYYNEVLYICNHELGVDRTVYHVYAVPYCLDLILFAYKKKYANRSVFCTP